MFNGNTDGEHVGFPLREVLALSHDGCVWVPSEADSQTRALRLGAYFRVAGGTQREGG